MPVILTFFNTRDLYSVCDAHPIKLIVAWFVPDHAINGKSQKKYWKTVRVEKNPFFYIKNNPPVFCFFEKKRVFVLFKKKHKSPFWNVFIASCNITGFRITHNLSLWHSNLRAKKYTPSLFSQSVAGQWYGLASTRTSNREKPLHTTYAVSRQVYANVQLV